MRIVNVGQRLVLQDPSGAGLDVEKASDGRFSGDPQAIFGQWDEFREWATGAGGRGDLAISPAELGAPTPAPRQVFAIGLNYAEHVNESGMGRPDSPTVFTKFPSSITGPNATVELPSGAVDWEVELVVAIGRQAYRRQRERCVRPRGRVHGRPGPVRAGRPAGRAGAAVLDGQVLPRVRAARACAGHRGRDRAPRRPRARLPAGRRGAAARADPRPDVQRARADLPAVRHLPAAARGHHLHRNPVRGRQRPRPEAVHPAGRRADQPHRGRWRAAERLRGGPRLRGAADGADRGRGAPDDRGAAGKPGHVVLAVRLEGS